MGARIFIKIFEVTIQLTEGDSINSMSNTKRFRTMAFNNWRFDACDNLLFDGYIYKMNICTKMTVSIIIIKAN